MRALPFLILFAAGAAISAHAAEDRYGPARAHQRPMQTASTIDHYQGRMLTWSSRAFVPQVPEPSTAPPPLVPMTAPAPPPIQRTPSAPSRPTQAAPPAPAAPMGGAAQASLPDSLYAPPPAPAPQRVAQAAPPAARGAEGSHVRLYSVHRQYGLNPDAIPEPPANGSNYVLIGAPADAPKPEAPEEQPF